jgi:hypothetical protein
MISVGEFIISDGCTGCPLAEECRTDPVKGLDVLEELYNVFTGDDPDMRNLDRRSASGLRHENKTQDACLHAARIIAETYLTHVYVYNANPKIVSSWVSIIRAGLQSGFLDEAEVRQVTAQKPCNDERRLFMCIE